ncbi:uncharacterized protein TNCV_2094891 [Trichonephila clavipes]|nr:uncharacterized protein TNCV_2094891 [Trichonephila clavipes]
MRKINLASREVADDSMKNAAKEVSASGSNEICVSGDGPKSGHSYEEWKLKHQPHCVKNHIGSSSKMEVDGMKEIFQRSVPQRNAKYMKYIGDGDTKTFPELQRTAPYSIEKVECVGHMQKRTGARLRKLKTMNQAKNYKTNNSSVSDMRQAIWAIYCHYRSTDEEPMHHFCPIGDTSWCKYQKAVATNSASLFKHKNIVPIAVMDEIKPIIAELSAPKLLKKCVGGDAFRRRVFKRCREFLIGLRSWPGQQSGLAIHQNDHQARRRFVEWAQNEIAVVPDFHKRILFSDEAHFWLNGYVNKQNCCIWSEANPQVYVETPLHAEKLTVWCALWAGGILLQKR